MFAAAGPCSWSDLPIDILILILERLELPHALAFASVCTTWGSAATAAGVPRSRAPWIMSWGNNLDKMLLTQDERCSSSDVKCCNLYHPVENTPDKIYSVSFPKGCFAACCGASHGWLILANRLSNLVLYNPVTSAKIHLPPVADFTCVSAIYDNSGNLKHYRWLGSLYEPICLGRWFYQKAVLSRSPSKGGHDYIVMIIHQESEWLSFVKAGQNKWQVASTLSGSGDRYLDCAHHKGSFYAVTLQGMVEKWDILDGPKRELIVSARPHPGCILTRHLVSTPWGDLLQVRVVLAVYNSDGIAFQICKIDPDGLKKVVQENVLMDHALFLGLNHSACLPTKNLPGIRPHCIYFSAPVITHAFDWLLQLRVWGGVRTYDLETGKFELSFPSCDDHKGLFYGCLPSEVWITQNL
uniref:F-box domain-containing protein n=1 Tax=Leersia perrieri TaxID=77586 RepID=A0A0D9VW36_9ORYZ